MKLRIAAKMLASLIVALSVISTLVWRYKSDDQQRLENFSTPSDTLEVKLRSPNKAPSPPLEKLVSMERAKISKMPMTTSADNMSPGPWLSANNSEKYQSLPPSQFYSTQSQPLSTFSIDVDTGAYANVRRYLNLGQLPPKDAVRVEEFINYFDYQYSAGASIENPFTIHTAMTDTPWRQGSKLLRIAIKGFEPPMDDVPPVNLVLLVDVSGSMNSPHKLPLLIQSMKLFVKQMRAEDKVSIVTYAGSSRTLVEGVSAANTQEIFDALNLLQAGGSTNGEGGINQAYSLARKHFIKDGVNRIFLATDGDFNVGTSNLDELLKLVERQRQSGIGLSTLGFGQGNYNDHLMEQVSNKGNGVYAYIDNIDEAQRVLNDNLKSSLMTIAKDVKIQVEFNPAFVKEYRLLGYENRALNDSDFNNDKVDAGDVGAGHSVTALYEVILADSNVSMIDKLKYGQSNTEKNQYTDELAQVKLRFKQPGQDISSKVTKVISLSHDEVADASFTHAINVAIFAQLLRQDLDMGDMDFYKLLSRIKQFPAQKDTDGSILEFQQLVRTAARLHQVQG